MNGDEHAIGSRNKGIFFVGSKSQDHVILGHI